MTPLDWNIPTGILQRGGAQKSRVMPDHQKSVMTLCMFHHRLDALSVNQQCQQTEDIKFKKKITP